MLSGDTPILCPAGTGHIIGRAGIERNMMVISQNLPLRCSQNVTFCASHGQITAKARKARVLLNVRPRRAPSSRLRSESEPTSKTASTLMRVMYLVINIPVTICARLFPSKPWVHTSFKTRLQHKQRTIVQSSGRLGFRRSKQKKLAGVGAVYRCPPVAPEASGVARDHR